MAPPLQPDPLLPAARPPGTGRILPIESLRGLMAVWVMATHLLTAGGVYFHTLPQPFSTLLGHGYAVEVFLIISGFVIFLVLDRKPQPYSRYVVRRACRILPIYWVCLAASVLMVNVSIDALQALPWLDHPSNTTRLDILFASRDHAAAHTVAHAFMLHGLFDPLLPHASYAFMGQAWSLTRLWQFYLVAPALFVLLFRRSPLHRVVCITVLIVLIRQVQLGPGFITSDAQYLGAGMLSWFLWTRRDHIHLGPRAWAVLVPAIAGILLLFTGDIPLVIWSVVFLAVVARDRLPHPPRMIRTMTGLLELRPLLTLGRLSYAIYVVHMLVLYALMRIATACEFGQTGFLVLLLTAGPILTLGLAWWLHHWVEVPCDRAGKRWAASPRAWISPRLVRSASPAARGS